MQEMFAQGCQRWPLWSQCNRLKQDKALPNCDTTDHRQASDLTYSGRLIEEITGTELSVLNDIPPKLPYPGTGILLSDGLKVCSKPEIEAVLPCAKAALA
jgi:hypothetical protein